MARPENAMEVFQLLNKSNCRRCGEKTCLAFAGAVYQGRRAAAECPELDGWDIARYADDEAPVRADEQFDELKQRAVALDFATAARRTGGRCSDSRLTIKILGKDLGIDHAGRFYSDIHLLPWVIGPFLRYVCDCRGSRLTGQWVPLRELRGGAELYPLFHRRIELAMQQVADRYPDLFGDMIGLFQGRTIESPFESDICVVLPVMPLVPIMICYWRPDEGMESSLLVFFDSSADDNIGTDSVYTLTAGLAQMFEKLALRHGTAVTS